jgi:hypothetical protein
MKFDQPQRGEAEYVTRKIAALPPASGSITPGLDGMTDVVPRSIQPKTQRVVIIAVVETRYSDGVRAFISSMATFAS